MEDVQMQQRQESHREYDVQNRFILRAKDFGKQYNLIYNQRLEALRPSFEERLPFFQQQIALPGSTPFEFVERIPSLSLDRHCMVIGTLFKTTKLLPTVLELYAKERSIPALPKGNFSSDKDTMVLEDESGSIVMKANDRTIFYGHSAKPFSLADLTTGIVVGVIGRQNEIGEFDIDAVCSAGLAPQEPLRSSLSDQKASVFPLYDSPSKPRNLICLVSGLSNCSPLAWEIVQQYIMGFIGDSSELAFASKITRLIIAGNSLPPIHNGVDAVAPAKSRKNNANQREAIQKAAAPLRAFDGQLAELAQSISIDLMPGPLDPSNYTYPQQPFHKCLFNIAANFNTFNCVTNPYEAQIESILVLGTAGQEVENMRQFTKIVDTIDFMEQMMHWRHIAPTAPDTLAAYPFDQIDPFVVNKCPHLFFIGNQTSFQTKLITGHDGQVCRLVSIPSFAQTGTVVLVDVESLETFPVAFAPLSTPAGSSTSGSSSSASSSSS